MVENNQVDGKNMPSTETTSINYLKRIKKALESSLGKKMKFGSIEKKLHEHELDFENFIDFLGQQYPGVPYDM